MISFNQDSIKTHQHFRNCDNFLSFYSSIPDEDDMPHDEFDQDEEEITDAFPVIGTCRAIYTFIGIVVHYHNKEIV